MAMIDYGAVVVKNGKVLNENIKFFDMDKTLGFEVKDAINKKSPKQKELIRDNYFAYVGTEKVFFCFYKCVVGIVSKNKDGEYEIKLLYESDLDGFKYNKFGVELSIYRSSLNRFIADITIGKDEYSVLFGYGIDSNFQNQLDFAYDYGISIGEIEDITSYIWNRPMAVVKVKRLKNKYYDKSNCNLSEKYKFKYIYKKYDR